MRRGFKCKSDVMNFLKGEYDEIVKNTFGANYLESIEKFEDISEKDLRKFLKEKRIYADDNSANQAWKSCKGYLYEYAVFKCLEYVINTKGLTNKLRIVFEDEEIYKYNEQVAIKNWKDIIPDVDMMILRNGFVKVIISCKTSLRERFTETAFWKQELQKHYKDIKIIFITPDKDEELKIEVNRYILMHIIDYTFITNQEKYQKIMSYYKTKYGKMKDFEILKSKINHITAIEEFLKSIDP